MFEVDERFAVFGKQFIHYDFNNPLANIEHLQGSFDYLIIDPPFLSAECWTKTSQTAKYLQKQGGKLMICTGMVMKDQIKGELGCNATDFEPRHKNGLSNEFGSFINYKSNHLKTN